MARVLFATLIALILASYASALSFTLNANREECFYENIASIDQKVMLQFQVSRGGHLDIDVMVYNPNNELVHSVERSSEGKFTIPVGMAGLHKVCFSNKMSTLTPKIVSFSISLGDPVNPDKYAKLDELDPIESAIAKLSEGLVSVQAEQQYLKDRERAHRDISDQTNSRIMKWAIFEFVALVGMGLFQIYYLKRFFSIKG